MVAKLGLDGLDLLARLLDYDPQKHITTAREALNHPLFNSIFNEILDTFLKILDSI